MNELLQKHGCSNVFTVPEGLKELMADITREVLRRQPPKLYDYITNYLSVLIITREHGILAVKILEDLCDCRPTVSEHLLELGIEKDEVDTIAQVIKEEIEHNEPVDGKEKVKEALILKKVLNRAVLDEELSAKVCQVARNAYRDYWYRKKLIEKHLKVHPEEPWEIAAQHTLELYKKTKPSFTELNRATQKIQAAYRGYYVRRNVLKHLKPKEEEKKKTGPKVNLSGPPVDVAGSREIDLGPVIILNVREENVNAIFENRAGERLGVQYDPMKTITHLDEAYFDASKPPFYDVTTSPMQQRPSRAHSYTAGMPIKPTNQGDKSPSFGASSRRNVVAAMVTPRRSRISYVTPPTLQTTADPSLQKISFSEYPAEVLLIDDLGPTDVPEDLPPAATSDDQYFSDDRSAADGMSVPTGSSPGAAGPSDVGNATDAEDIPEDLPNDEL